MYLLFFFNLKRVLFSEIFLTQLILNIKEKIKNNVHLTEDLETLTEAVAGDKLPAEELSKLPQLNSQEETGFGGETSVEQLTDEEKNTRQVTWKTYSGESSEDEDPTPAPVKMPIQENKVQNMKIDEVGWVKIKG